MIDLYEQSRGFIVPNDFYALPPLELPARKAA